MVVDLALRRVAALLPGVPPPLVLAVAEAACHSSHDHANAIQQVGQRSVHSRPQGACTDCQPWHMMQQPYTQIGCRGPCLPHPGGICSRHVLEADPAQVLAIACQAAQHGIHQAKTLCGLQLSQCTLSDKQNEVQAAPARGMQHSTAQHAPWPRMASTTSPAPALVLSMANTPCAQLHPTSAPPALAPAGAHCPLLSSSSC